MGEAAGTAAALSSLDNGYVGNIEINRLQKQLLKQKVFLGDSFQ